LYELQTSETRRFLGTIDRAFVIVILGAQNSRMLQALYDGGEWQYG